MEDCVFCKIIKGEIPKELIYKDNDVVVFKSNKPVALHHLLIVPVKHIENYLELDNEILNMTKVSQKIIKNLKIENGYKLVFNGGKYQEIAHVHWHLLAGDLHD